ncbi:unnamed protein product, partial [Tenebrio molitor]
TNLIRQSGPTAACLHLVLLCGRDSSEAAALAVSGGRRHPHGTPARCTRTARTSPTARSTSFSR